MKKAIPPRLGVCTECELRSFGSSMRRLYVTTPIIRGITSSVQTMLNANSDIKIIGIDIVPTCQVRHKGTVNELNINIIIQVLLR